MIYTVRNSYLHEREVNNKWKSATKYGVCTVFCAMSHAVMPSITCKN